MSIARQFVLFLAILLPGVAALAQDVGVVEAELVGERPGSGGEATLVNVGLYIIDIDAVDDARQRFSIDMFVNIAWQDPRLALAAENRANKVRSLPLNEIWTPRALIVNDRGVSPRLPMIVEVDDSGNVQYRQRFYGELAVDLELHEFPFDTQRLPVDVISYQYSPQEVRLESRLFASNGESDFSAEGWSFRLTEPEYGEFRIPEAGVARPRLTFVVEAQRNVRYYVFTMFLPVSLIIFMSWTAFWLQPELVPSRIGISTASIFSLIAFSFSIRLSLPHIAYMTRADLFVMGSMLLVFLALGAAVVGSRWASADNMPKALRLNAITRWVYAGLFGAVVATAMFV
jgi:hypothetical protein